MKRHATRVACQKCHELELAGWLVDGSQFLGAGIEQPQLAPVQPRGTRHQQAGADDVVGFDSDHTTTTNPTIPSSISHVAAPNDGYMVRMAILHGQPIRVAAVFGRKSADEGRFPKQIESLRAGNGGDSTEQGVRKDLLPVPLGNHAMHILIAATQGWRGLKTASCRASGSPTGWTLPNRQTWHRVATSRAAGAAHRPTQRSSVFSNTHSFPSGGRRSGTACPPGQW